MHRARVLVAVAISVLMVATTAVPSLAATSVHFNASFAEQTTPQKCPPQFPPGTFCFTGTGTGPVILTPPGTPIPGSTEQFAGDVDPTGHSHSIVSITVPGKGTLFMVANGIATATADNENWTVVGGTGAFDDATGSGTVTTVATGVNANGQISSTSTYNGSLTLR